MAKTSMERIKEWGEIIAGFEEAARDMRPRIERMPRWLKPLFAWILKMPAVARQAAQDDLRDR